jgi:hypothetical protein
MRVRVRGDIHKTCYENLIKLSCCRHRDMVVGALKSYLKRPVTWVIRSSNPYNGLKGEKNM